MKKLLIWFWLLTKRLYKKPTFLVMLFLVPLLLIMPRVFGIEGVWYCMPIADVASAILAGILLTIQVRKLRQNPDSERSI